MNSRFAGYISYLGLNFCGWQRQDASRSGPLPSIQERVEQALQRVLQQNVRVQASGRTDAGVHALSQAIHFDFINSRGFTAEKLRGALNANLPPEIRVWKLLPVPNGFHVTDSAKSKTYCYWIIEGATTIPGLDPLALWTPFRINWGDIRKASKAFIGTHDFKAFEGRGGNRKTTIRTIHKVSISKNSTPIPGTFLYQIQVTGSGFLKQMVRSMVGTLLDIGRGALPVNHVKILLSSGVRAKIGKTAPAKGLWLTHVSYGRNSPL